MRGAAGWPPSVFWVLSGDGGDVCEEFLDSFKAFVCVFLDAAFKRLQPFFRLLVNFGEFGVNACPHEFRRIVRKVRLEECCGCVVNGVFQPLLDGDFHQCLFSFIVLILLDIQFFGEEEAVVDNFEKFSEGSLGRGILRWLGEIEVGIVMWGFQSPLVGGSACEWAFVLH